MSISQVLHFWQYFSKYRLGKWLFSYLIRFVNPYSGILGAYINVLEPGYTEVLLTDKKKNRNHLNSVHAIALTNLGELSSGLALLSSLKPHMRGIVTHISIDFLKKARGTLKAVCDCKLPEIKEDTDFILHSNIFDEHDDCVARVEVRWKLGLTHE